DEFSPRVGGVGVADLRGDRRSRGDQHVLVAAGSTYGEPIFLIGFVIHLFGRQARCQSVPPHRVGAPCRVDGDVVDGPVVGTPGRARADADDLVGILLAGD